MADSTLTIKKIDVYEEVAKTTAYIGAKNKLEDGKSAFDQVFVTDADLAMIERFYNESAFCIFARKQRMTAFLIL